MSPVSPIARNPKSRAVARSFLEALFNVAGAELPWSEIQRRVVASQLSCSIATLNSVAGDLVEEGFLERPSKGLYRRPVPPATPLALDPGPESAPDSVVGSEPATPEPEVSLFQIYSLLVTINKRLDALVPPALRAAVPSAPLLPGLGAE